MFRKTLLGIVATATLALGLAACGGTDNVAACNDWLEASSCGETDFSQFVNCSAYENTSCDISDYFDCLTTNTTCTDGVADTSGWSACAAEATCS